MFDIGEGDCLVVVDVQNDFCPGGALGVAEGDQVVPVLNAWIREFHKKGLPVITPRTGILKTIAPLLETAGYGRPIVSKEPRGRTSIRIWWCRVKSAARASSLMRKLIPVLTEEWVALMGRHWAHGSSKGRSPVFL